MQYSIVGKGEGSLMKIVLQILYSIIVFALGLRLNLFLWLELGKKIKELISFD